MRIPILGKIKISRELGLSFEKTESVTVRVRSTSIQRSGASLDQYAALPEIAEPNSGGLQKEGIDDEKQES